MSKIKIDDKRCVHCGVCTSACRSNALSIDKKNFNLIYKIEKCVGCESCVGACPTRAIYIPLELRWLCV
jgi:NAD-dependent dihydropyrimidine dehydrogenase PreA subunit